MKRCSAVFVAVLISLGALAAPARADIFVTDNNKTLDVDCAKDPQITLAGNHITLTTTGVCTKISVTGNYETVTGSANQVSVTGNHNTITLAAADEVGILGNNNTVSVGKAVTRKTPKIGNVGKANHVTQPK